MPSRTRPKTAAPRRPLLVPAAVAALAALALAGCSGGDVTHARVPKGEEGSGGGGMPMGGMGGGEVPPPPRPTEGVLHWTLPKGWTETDGGGMRFATLVAPAKGKLDVSVVVLPGPAGGELANVNRWRGQIGLPPMDEAAMAAARKAVKTKAGEVALYDFTSEGTVKSRIVAGLIVVQGNTWFVKMVGDLDPVVASRRDFIRIVESLRLD